MPKKLTLTEKEAQVVSDALKLVQHVTVLTRDLERDYRGVEPVQDTIQQFLRSKQVNEDKRKPSKKKKKRKK